MAGQQPHHDGSEVSEASGIPHKGADNKTLHRYQLRICESSKDQNAIVVLPTGSGKTLIAAALAKWHHTTKGGKTLFLVPTQMLVKQQGNAVQEFSNLRVAYYHGELEWPRIDYDVLVSTPEAFRLKLASSEISFRYFSFVIFDEVHHVVKKHPYRKLARLLEQQQQDSNPTILGLTATCTYAVGESQIESDISKLCEALGISMILSATKEELVRDGYHGATPKMEVSVDSTTTSTTQNEIGTDDIIDVFDQTKGDSKFMPHQSREAFFNSIDTRQADPLLLRLMDFTRLVENRIQSHTPTFRSPLGSTGKSGKVTAWSEYASKLRDVPESDVLIHLYEALRLMVVTLSAGMDLVLEYLRMTINDKHYLCLQNLGPTLERILQDGNIDAYTKRFRRLKDVLMQKNTTYGVKFRGILFVQQRLTTHILQYYIGRTTELAMFHTACIYATSGEASPTFRVTASESKQRIFDFSKGDVNLLISTAVAEEGMDVPDANCIIRFDPILTPVSFVQGRGRARQEKSSFVIMEEREDRSVEQLAAAEQAQRTVINNKGERLINAEESRRKRIEAQQNRDQSAIQWLKVAQGLPISIVKTYCKKSDREVTECLKRDGDGWKASVCVFRTGSKEDKAETTCSTKQEAKNSAFAKLLTQLKGSL